MLIREQSLQRCTIKICKYEQHTQSFVSLLLLTNNAWTSMSGGKNQAPSQGTFQKVTKISLSNIEQCTYTSPLLSHKKSDRTQ